MKHSRSRRASAGLSAILAASLLAVPAAGAASAASSDKPPETPVSGQNPFSGGMTWEKYIQDHIMIVFDNVSIRLHAEGKARSNTVMVPAAPLLEGLGYNVKWDAKTGKLTAEHPGKAKPAQTYQAKQKKTYIGGKTHLSLEAPFIEEGQLWIPLRAAAEAAGLKVKWSSKNRTVIVSDPLAPPRISVATRASDNVDLRPAKLEQYSREHLNVDATIIPIRTENYREKTNVMIAAGDMSSLMLLSQPYQFNDSLFESIAIDLEEYLQSFPRLKALAEDGGRTINGHTFSIPRPADKNDAPFIVIRKDWLDVLNLAQPKTMDELYQVLDHFVHDDPDGNGKHDTIGLAGLPKMNVISWAEQAFTSKNGRFSAENGNVTDHAAGAQEKQALEWLKKANDSGLLHTSVTNDDSGEVHELVKSKRVGAVLATFDQILELSSGDVPWIPLTDFKATPNSEEIIPLRSPEEDSYVVSSMSRANPQVVLKWLDQGIAMAENGDWERVAGLEDEDRSAIYNLFGRSDMLKNNKQLEALPQELQDIWEAAVKRWRSAEVTPAALTGTYPILYYHEYIDMNTELDNLKRSVIQGEATIADWDKHVAAMTGSKAYKAMMKELQKLASAT